MQAAIIIGLVHYRPILVILLLLWDVERDSQAISELTEFVVKHKLL